MAVVYKPVFDYSPPSAEQVLYKLRQLLQDRYPDLYSDVMSAVNEEVTTHTQLYTDEMNEAVYFLLTAYDVLVKTDLEAPEVREFLLEVVVESQDSKTEGDFR